MSANTQNTNDSVVVDLPANSSATTVLKSRRREFSTFEDIRRYEVVDTILNRLMQQMEPLGKEKKEPLFVAVLKTADNHSILVSTKEAFLLRAQELQNIKTMLRVKHGFLNVEEATASQAVIRDYLLNAHKQVREGALSLQQQSLTSNNIALQELQELVKRALNEGASDIHIYLNEAEAQIQFRIDGVFTRPFYRERGVIAPMIAAALNVKSDDFISIYNEHEINANTINVPDIIMDDPETGEQTIRTVRLRIQKTPSHDGFRVTARIQDNGVQKKVHLKNIVLDHDVKAIVTHAFNQPTGIILFSGPVGEGKTTTLVAFNDIFIEQNKKVISLEDPIEIIQPGIQQTKCIPGDPELNFPNMIKIALREDMDVLQVSEIRDLETGIAGIRGAVTGHLVISTIHANSAIGIVPRLIDLGIEAKQLAQPNVLRALTAQRLVPRLCPSCKKKEPVNRDIPYPYGLDYFFILNQEGCASCNYRGIVGRQLIMEAIVVDKQSRDFIGREDFDGWASYLNENGYKTMAMRAWEHIEAGYLDPHIASVNIPDMWANSDAVFDYAALAAGEIVL